MGLLFTYHPVWLLLAAVIAFLYAFLLYRKDTLLEDVQQWLKWVLASIRFLGVFIILVLLIGIILEHFTERKEQPLIFVVNDSSASITLTKDSTYYATEYLENLNQLKENLSADFEVLDYSFSNELTRGFDTAFDGKTTDLSVVFNTIYDQYTNRNIGGIIMASDGIYNTGANPIYAIERKSFVPVFTIGLGDTNRVKDVRIDRVNHNDIAFLGNDFPVEVSVSQTKCNGENITVSIYEGDRLIKQEKRTLTGDQSELKVAFTIKADKVGFRKYTAQVTGVANEYSLKNNQSNFYIEIIDGRQKILIATEAPHPDVAAFRFVIENNKNYEVEVQKISEISNLKPYDLVLVHNYQRGNAVLDDYLSNGKVPALLIVGSNADVGGLSKLQVGFSGTSSDKESVGASFNSNFKEILLSPEAIQLIANAPPLEAPFGNINFSSAIQVMAYQKVGNISLDNPLIYFTQKQGSRLGAIMGEGLWRWRLFNQFKNKNTNYFNEFCGKLITYLAVKENKDPFKIQLENEYTENENIVIKAEVYNQSYDLINEEEVAFTYENENGEKFESYFAKRGDAYQLNLGTLKQGIYTWEAKTTVQNQPQTKRGTFLVREVKVEFLNTVANHRLLRNIASNSGGEFFYPNELPELENTVKSRSDMVTVVYKEKEFDDLIDYKWLFFLIVLLFAVEWFVRKYQGAY